ncbi:MAG TPA: glycogen debranching N-terminal domain-containing protein [Candidatus Dormibacteraeota bacterium]
MPDELFAVDGTSFVLSRRSGDIEEVTDGLFVHDARYISRWVLTLNGKRPRLLTSHHVDHYSTLCFLANVSSADLPANALTIVRRRVVGGGMEEELELVNHLLRAVEVDVRLEVDADFLDLFEVKARQFLDPLDQVFTGPNQRKVERGLGEGANQPVVFAHEDRLYSGRVTIQVDPAPETVDARGLRWRLRLEPYQKIKIPLKVLLEIQDQSQPATWTMRDFATEPAAVIREFRRRRIVAFRLATSWAKLERLYRRSLLDITALLIRDPALDLSLPAAGLPWFMAVFGRDTLITCYQLLPGGTALAWGALRMLASLQASEDDPERDAQPGRIIHELRRGPVAVNQATFPYYGTIDAPLLFLILLHEAWRWTGDDEMARTLRPSAEAILKWMDDFGDLDGDGFIEYHRRSARGLKSQSWKDSWDAIRFHDGNVAESPIASAEVQGYAYDALLRVAELARGPWADPKLADRLTSRSRTLFDRFNEVFWTSARGGFYHLALDRGKRGVDSKTSNMGHLLWSGIVPMERAPLVVSQLMSKGMFSGWGIRTMSTEDLGFNPISYHCGTVWPHDNSLIIEGLHRYGFHEEANRIMVAMVDAADRFPDGRLPEAFAGYDRSVGPFPVGYPTACIPQAWAAGTPFLMLRTALGTQPDADRGVVLEPHLPEFVDRLRIMGYLVRGRIYDLEVMVGKGKVSMVGSLSES